MQEEIDTLLKELPADSEVADDGRRTYHSGHLWGTPVVVAFSRWGKVAAATTATHLISDFCVAEILFTGVAGASQPWLKIGDIVVGARLWQHDMDARHSFRGTRFPCSAVLRLPAMKSDGTNCFKPRRLSSATIYPKRHLKPPEPRSIFNRLRPSREISPAATNFSHTAPGLSICSSAYRPLQPLTWRARPSPRSATSTASRSQSCAQSPTPPTNPPPTIFRASLDK